MPQSDLYQGRDVRDIPAYGISEAARYLRIPSTTLRSWFIGRSYQKRDGVGSSTPLVYPADPQTPRLSFSNLVEAYVLHGLRAIHHVELRNVRAALAYAEVDLGVNRPLLTLDLYTHAGHVFLQRYGELINLSKSGQLAMRKILESYLQRVERDAHNIPLRLYPFLDREYDDSARTVVIDPTIAFGRPTVTGKGVGTAVLASRIDAGETVDVIADDYGISTHEVEDAIIFERRAA